MTAVLLFSELRDRGVEFVVDGDRLRWRGPPGAVRPRDVERLRAAKPALLDLMRSGRLISRGYRVERSTDPPIRELQREWAAAYAKARAAFATGVEPTPQAAARLELRLAEESWGLVSPTRAEARALLAEVYAGRLGARLREDGRVVLGARGAA